jgi:hypothetical protein
MSTNPGIRTSWALTVALLLLLCLPVGAQSLLVPMDAAQSDHLRAYGLAYWCLQEPRSLECEWLLNYRGGSFLLPDLPVVRDHARTMGVAAEPLKDAARQSIYATIRAANMERVQLTKAPKIAVYVPPDAEPWDDAVRLALEYAQIEYVKLWDREVLTGKLADYEWLHLHHEDFTGQFGRFFATFQNQPWYRRMVMSSREVAQELGYTSVQEEKAAVAKRIADWTAGGGFLFAMCSAPDSLDIALAARGRDIVPPEIDGTPVDPAADANLNYAATLAFRGFHLTGNAFVPELSDIDVPPAPGDLVYRGQTFELFEFSAKQDPIATMLNQCHVKAVPDFLGLTTAFRRSLLKSTAIVLGDFPGDLKVKYIHGDFGKGTYTFLAGHDPEDYAHVVGEPATDLTQHRHSPGYRLILNNVLFPAAKTKERKT